ncbi:Glutamine-dependent NAD(+) synthetase [Halotydeus destructor]|nr:Glutamine-dependent NAD(+) synthetase [Halotydeus destructor]
MTAFNVAVCSLNQLALDFEGNCERILESIKLAQHWNAIIRVGPELEISGYSCEDAFFEVDTVTHSWQVLHEIISADFKDIIIDVGMPIMRNSSLFNCRVIIVNGKVILIRPKTKLASGGNYREERWFTAWEAQEACSAWFELPLMIQEVTGQTHVPFGADIVLDVAIPQCLQPLRIGWEVCEELWRPDAAHVKLFGQRGCHVVCNSSGSYWEIRKLNKALDLMKTATAKSGGIYAFANLVGGDGARVCFYGRSLVTLNGQLVTRTTTEADIFDPVQVAVARVSLNDVEMYRQQNGIKPISQVIDTRIDFDGQFGYSETTALLKSLTVRLRNINVQLASAPDVLAHRPMSVQATPEQEIFLYAPLWLWDYLRKSGMGGFILPLSGGIDSASVACIVYAMCHLLYGHIQKPSTVTDTICKLLNTKADTIHEVVKSPKDIALRLLRCCYLATKFSGTHSLDRATQLAALLGAQFVEYDFNHLYEDISGNVPYFGPEKRSLDEVSLLQQNIQARLRMLLTYYLSGGNRLVLASGNVDEALVGYLTKYDCSSADINPIGSISKQDLRSFMKYFEGRFFADTLPTAITSIVLATPSAELTGADQSDEADLGLTYEELSIFGRLRRGDLGCYGPFEMFLKLWSDRKCPHLHTAIKHIEDAECLAVKVKRFFVLYARNRHKQTVLTPSLHSETYSPDDNRFDHRQFLFDSTWKWQFKQIDRKLDQLKKGALLP